MLRVAFVLRSTEVNPAFSDLSLEALRKSFQGKVFKALRVETLVLSLGVLFKCLLVWGVNKSEKHRLNLSGS